MSSGCRGTPSSTPSRWSAPRLAACSSWVRCPSTDARGKPVYALNHHSGDRAWPGCRRGGERVRPVRRPARQQLEAVGAFWSPSKRRQSAAITAFLRRPSPVVLPPETLTTRSSGRPAWQRARAGIAHGRIRICAAPRSRPKHGRRMMVAAVEHDTGVVLGQVEVDRKSNEIPAVRELLRAASILTGRIAPWTRCTLSTRPRAGCSGVAGLRDERGQGQPGGDLRRPQGVSTVSDALWHAPTVDKGHGRIERRRCANVVDLSGAGSGTATPTSRMGDAQAMPRIEREREILTQTGKRSIEVTCEPHLCSAQSAPAPEEARTGAQPSGSREPKHLRARPWSPTTKTDAGPTCVTLPRNLACLTRGHRHRAARRTLPNLRQRPTGTMPCPGAGGPRRDHDRAQARLSTARQVSARTGRAE